MSKSKERIAADAAIIGMGGATAYSAIGPLTGTQHVYHGTNKENFEGIKQHGIRPDRGAAKGGIADSWADELQANIPKDNSTGHVYVTRHKPLAQSYARIHSMTPEEKKKFFKAFAESGGNASPDSFKASTKNGVIADIRMNYDKYLRMASDPEVPLQRELERTGFPKYMAARGTEAIDPEEITNGAKSFAEQVKYHRKNFGAYFKNHPKRFARGVGTALLGTGVAAYGSNRLYNDAIKKEASMIITEVKERLDSK